jgi:hypothetical protein
MRAVIAGVLMMALTAPAAAAETPKEDKMVCKRSEDPYTGSHLSRPKKTCMKASEWKELEDETQRTMRRVGDNHGVDPNTPAPIGGSPR